VSALLVQAQLLLAGVLDGGVGDPHEDALLGVQPVLGLVEDDRLRPVDHLVGDLDAA
jgi:hypothetical protein